MAMRKEEPHYLPSLSPPSFALMTLKSLLFLLFQFSFHGNWSGHVISLLRCRPPGCHEHLGEKLAENNKPSQKLPLRPLPYILPPLSLGL